MALTCNGTTQYVSLGAGTNLYQSRPLTVAVLFNAGALRTTGSYNGLIGQGDYAGQRGWQFEIEGAAALRAYFAWRTSPSASDHFSTWALVANSGWWFVAAVARDIGASTSIDFYGYRYGTNAFFVSTSTGAADSDPPVPSGADVATVGATQDVGAVIDFYPGQIGWAAVFDGDLGNAGSAVAPRIWQLIHEGPWGMLNSSCKFFLPLSHTYGLKDLRTPGRVGTLIAAPTWSAPSPTEAAPILPTLWIVNAVNTGSAVAGVAAGVATADAVGAFDGALIEQTPHILAAIYRR